MVVNPPTAVGGLWLFPVNPQAEVVPAVAQPQVKGRHVLEAVEDHLVAAELAGLLGDGLYQGGADAAPLEVLVDGDVLDVADQSAVVNELPLDQQRGGADDAVVDLGDVSSLAGPQPGLEHL